MVLIKSDDQRQKALKRIEGVQTQIEKVRKSHGPEKMEAFAQVMRRHLADLKEQVRAYGELKESR